MRSEGNEDETSNHEHQKDDSSLSCETGKITHATHLLVHERASQKKHWRAIRCKCGGAEIFVDENRCASLDYVWLYTRCWNSQAIESVSFAKLSEMKCELEIVAYVIVNYIQINKEAERLAVIDNTKAMVGEACKQVYKIA